MKKLLMIAVLIGFLTSCKKDYTCKCVAAGITLSDNSIGKLTKDEADDACNASDNSLLGIECTAVEK
jgi:hypothetical protein